MEDNRCLNSDCILNAEYACPCSSPPVYMCKWHILNHMKTPNKNHALKLIFGEPCEKTKTATPLIKCDSNIIEEFNNKFKEEEKIQRNFKNISIEKDLEEKSEFLDSSKNSEERKLKGSFLACLSDSTVLKISAAQYNQDIVSNYQHKASLFNLVRKDKMTNLLIYNTEIESRASIILDTPQSLDFCICITQLPNDKLFCFGNYSPSGITLLIDENYRVQELPSGTACWASSTIYSSNNVYCFGGIYNKNSLTLSSRFDLDRNQWTELTPLPNTDCMCNSIIFNGSILISGYENKNLLRHSIDSNSFSTIPYDFEEKTRKILINAERLYLIECKGSIYESEIGSDTAWRKIKNNSKIGFTPYQTYCQCNKEKIYIGCINWRNEFFSFKFNLNEKRLLKLV